MKQINEKSSYCDETKQQNILTTQAWNKYVF